MNYGSFQSGTEQGLHRNEQPPPTQQGAFLKGKGAVVANAVTSRRLGLDRNGGRKQFNVNFIVKADVFLYNRDTVGASCIVSSTELQ